MNFLPGAIALPWAALSLLSCSNVEKKTNSRDTDTAIVAKAADATLFQITDTGQTWFRVILKKNDTTLLDYEGSWPIFFESGNSATVQLFKSKDVMSINDGLTIYLNSVKEGKVPLLLSSSDKNTASAIFSPVADGAYGLPISIIEGWLDLQRKPDSTVSGKFEGKGREITDDVYSIKGYFLNARINPERL